MKILLFILFPIIVFGQKGAMTYAEANPGVLSVLIDVSSDTAHLKSIIGVLQKNDISKLKTFLGKNDTLELVTQSGKSKRNTDEQVKNILDKVLQRNIEPCKILASDTSYAIFNTPLENEVIRPLILWVKKHYNICQMQSLVLGLEDAKRKIELRNNKVKKANQDHISD